MTYTMTLNPAIDHSMETEDLRVDVMINHVRSASKKEVKREG